MFTTSSSVLHLAWQYGSVENSDRLRFGPVVYLENLDYLLENSDHSQRIWPIRLENSDY